MSRKGKGTVSGTDESVVERIKWDLPTTKLFLDLLNGWKQKNIGAIKWDKISDEFKELTGICVPPPKLKTKHDNMKQNWQLFSRLMQSETGLGFNYSTGLIEASDEWWTARIAENSNYKKFRTIGLPLRQEQDVLWGGKNATGDDCVSAATAYDGYGTIFGDDDVYTPQLQTQTGVEDFVDLMSTGTSPMKNNTPAQPSVSTGKRSRAADSSRKGKKKIVEDDDQFKTMIGLVNNQTEEQRAYFAAKKEYYEGKKFMDPTYEQAVKLLVELDIEATNPEIFYFSVELFNTNSQRLLFLALPASARFGYLERLFKKSNGNVSAAI